MNCGHQSRDPKKSKGTPELIEHMDKWIGNNPQVFNSPIFNDTLLVTDTYIPGKKIRVSKLLLHVSICEIHNYLISNSIIYQLKEAIDKTTRKPLISYTALCAIMPDNFRKIIDRYKQMCGYKICIIICYMQALLNSYRLQHLNLLR